MRSRAVAGRFWSSAAVVALAIAPIAVLATSAAADAGDPGAALTCAGGARTAANGAQLRDAWECPTTTSITLTINIVLGDSSGGVLNDCHHGYLLRSSGNSGLAITVDGTGAFGITQLCAEHQVLADWVSGEAVTLTGLTHFTGGQACGAPGGGLYAEGAAHVVNSDVSDNEIDGTCINSDASAQVPPAYLYGGGVYANNGPSTITGSTFSGNYAPQGGGAVAVDDALTVSDSTFEDNRVGGPDYCHNESCYGGALNVHDATHVSGSTFTDNSLRDRSGDLCGECGIYGGAIATTDADIAGSSFDGNNADCVGACNNEGGAVWVYETASADSSSFTGNHASCQSQCSNSGGAIFADGDVAVTASTLSGNDVSCDDECQAEGAGVFSGALGIGKYKDRYPGVTTTAAGGWFGPSSSADPSRDITISTSRFSGNTAVCDGLDCGADGGGVYVGAPTSVTVDASTFDANVAKFYGGALSVGGLETTAPVTFTNSTVTDNSSGEAGAIDASDPLVNLTLAYDTIVQNHSVPVADAPSGKAVSDEPAGFEVGGTFTSFGTIVALSDGGANCLIDGTHASQGYNWSDDDSCEFTKSTDLVDTPNDPGLNALGDWGGPTPTMLPLTPLHGGVLSPVIDAIPASACRTGVAADITTDQRGITRPQLVGCDIGAVEVTFDELTVLPAAVVVPPPVVIQPKFTG